MVSLLHAKDWTYTEWFDYYVACDRESEGAMVSGRKSWFGCIDVDAVKAAPLDGITTHEMEAFRVGPYAVLYSIATPWYNPREIFLQEHLVIRVGAVGSFRCVPEALIQRAQELGCGHIVVGDALTIDDRLARVYNRYGFQVEAQSMIRRV